MNRVERPNRLDGKGPTGTLEDRRLQREDAAAALERAKVVYQRPLLLGAHTANRARPYECARRLGHRERRGQIPTSDVQRGNGAGLTLEERREQGARQIGRASCRERE